MCITVIDTTYINNLALLDHSYVCWPEHKTERQTSNGRLSHKYNLVFGFVIDKSSYDSLDKNLTIFIEIIDEIKAP